MPVLQARSPMGDMQEATTHWCFLPSLSPSLPSLLSLPLCLKWINKTFFKKWGRILPLCYIQPRSALSQAARPQSVVCHLYVQEHVGTHTCTSDWLQWILVSTLHGIGNHHSFLILNICLSVFTQDQTPYSYVEIPVSFFQSVCIQQSHSPNTCIFIQLMGIEDRFPALFCPQSDLLVSYLNRWIQNSIWGEARSKTLPSDSMQAWKGQYFVGNVTATSSGANRDCALWSYFRYNPREN